MEVGFKDKVKQLLIRTAVKPWQNMRRQGAIRAWRKSGSPNPPPHALKQEVVKSYAKAYALDTLVETGTFNGTMVYAQIFRFAKIISIELGVELYKKARQNFEKYPHVEILQGNSAEMLPWIVQRLDKPALFWLDAHYSGGNTAIGDKITPILQELEAIWRSGKKHVILIDDARLFTGEDGYPPLIEVRNRMVKYRPDHHFEVADDIIRLYPPLQA